MNSNPSPEELAQAVRDAEEALAAMAPPAFQGLSAYEARRRALYDADIAKLWAGRGRPPDGAWIAQAAGILAVSLLLGLWLGRLTPLPWYGAVPLALSGGLLLGAFVAWRGRKKRVDTTLYDAMAAAYGTAEPAGILTVCAEYEKLYTKLHMAQKKLRELSK
jgi:hypothetical protein